LSETSPAGSLSDAERRTLKELLLKMAEPKEQTTP
jgi:hypothetical protein